MVELAFGDSPAGALKWAKSMKQGEKLTGAVGVIGGTKKERRKAKKLRQWSGLTMAGSPNDVEALTLALDIGDISDMNARKRLLDDLSEDFPGVSDEIWKTNQHALNRIQAAKSALEPVRMWISSSDPAELCGLYFICHFMADAQTPLLVVDIPRHIKKDKTFISYRSTGEVSAEEFGALAEYEESLSECQRSTYAGLWSDLVHENAGLRAVVNGNVMGVPEDFYDFVLKKNIPEGEFRVAQLIGNTLLQVPGVGDRWLFMRIKAMIQAGELMEISATADGHPYSGIIKKNR